VLEEGEGEGDVDKRRQGRRSSPNIKVTGEEENPPK